MQTTTSVCRSAAAKGRQRNRRELPKFPISVVCDERRTVGGRGRFDQEWMRHMNQCHIGLGHRPRVQSRSRALASRALKSRWGTERRRTFVRV